MGPRAGSKRPLRSILDRFCKVLGGSENIWGGFGKGFRRIFSIHRPLPVNCPEISRRSPEASRRPSRFPEFCRKSFELFLTASTKQRGGGAAKRTKFAKKRTKTIENLRKVLRDALRCLLGPSVGQVSKEEQKN